MSSPQTITHISRTILSSINTRLTQNSVSLGIGVSSGNVEKRELAINPADNISIGGCNVYLEIYSDSPINVTLTNTFGTHIIPLISLTGNVLVLSAAFSAISLNNPNSLVANVVVLLS